VTAAPSQHFSGPRPEGPQRDAVVVAGDPHGAAPVFFSGDTGLTTEYTA
jgi:hypothetical protein